MAAVGQLTPMSSDWILSTGCPTSSEKKLAREGLPLRLARSTSAGGDDTPFCFWLLLSSALARLPLLSATGFGEQISECGLLSHGSRLASDSRQSDHGSAAAHLSAVH